MKVHSAMFSLLLVSAFATSGLAATKYSIKDIGAGVIPAAINKNGDVVGTIISAETGPEAFLYRGGTVTGLGRLGGLGSWGVAINDAAEILGTICMNEVCKEHRTWGLPQPHPFLLKDGQVTDLLATAGITAAERINSSGLILGKVPPPDTLPEGLPEGCWLQDVKKVILYDYINGDMTDVGVTCAPNEYLIPTGLNDLGEAVFVVDACGSLECSTPYLFSDGTLHALPEERFVAWYAVDINDKGQIVGTTPASLDKGVIYTDDFRVIEDLKYLRFTPVAINNYGLMVGHSADMRSIGEYPLTGKPLAPPYSRAATFNNGELALLEKWLAKTDDQWVLEWVYDLNDQGQIVGSGTKNGERNHGFILTPVKLKDGDAL